MPGQGRNHTSMRTIFFICIYLSSCNSHLSEHRDITVLVATINYQRDGKIRMKSRTRSNKLSWDIYVVLRPVSVTQKDLSISEWLFSILYR